MMTAPLSLCSRPRRGDAGAVRRALVGCAGALFVSISAAAFAQFSDWPADKGIRLTPLLEKVVESKGPDGAARYTLAPGVVTAGGEQFVLTLRFTNATGITVDGVRITSTMPAGVSYVAGSATGPGGLVVFSVDGGRTFGTEQELAPLHVYTHVRWVLEAPLEAGATGFVRLRALSR